MNFEAWTIFATFWVVFVITPGPNAVNCISNGMSLGFVRSLPGVAAVLTQATAFMLLSAAGVTTLIAASPAAFGVAKLAGAAVLIWLGIRGWMRAGLPVTVTPKSGQRIYGEALAIATINPKSVAGYLAAFSQFVQPDVPIWSQMWVILPTSLTITCVVYLIYTALGAGLDRAAVGAIFHTTVRRGMAMCFILYGVLLGAVLVPQGRV